MDVYGYDNISGQVLTIGSYTIPIGGDVVSNGAEIPELEAYVGKGLRKFKNTQPQVQLVTRNPSTGDLCADGEVITNVPEYDPRFPYVYVNSGDTWTTVKSKLETKLPEQINSSPAGLGREILVASGEFRGGVVSLSSMQSIEGTVKGCSVLRIDYNEVLPPGTGTYGHLTIQNDYETKDNINPQASIRDMFFHGGKETVPVGVTLHGYYCGAAVAGLAHEIQNTTFAEYNGNGVHIEGAMDQQCTFRMKCTGNNGWGAYYKDCSDMKHFGTGLGGNLTGALYLEHVATPYFHCFDFWNPNSGYKGTYTVHLNDQARAIFDTGTIAGRVFIQGRNDQGVGVRYDMTGIVFRSVDFKVDETLDAQYAAVGGSGAAYTSQIKIEDCSDVLLDACKWMFNDVSPTAVSSAPDYAIEITTTAGSSLRKGFVRLANASGLVHKRGMVGEVAPVLAFTKHYTNEPGNIEWVDFDPGTPILVRTSYMASGARKNYLAPGTYNKSDYPFGYLWFGTGTPLLDDVGTEFTLPAGPYAAPADYTWAYRVWP